MSNTAKRKKTKENGQKPLDGAKVINVTYKVQI